MNRYLHSQSAPQRPPKESGQGTVEFALISVILMVTIFAIVDLGRAMSIYSFLAGAAQASARTGTVASNSIAVIKAVAEERMSAFGTDAMTIAINQSGDHTEVTLTYAVDIITPLVASVIGTNTINLTSTARARKLGGTTGP